MTTSSNLPDNVSPRHFDGVPHRTRTVEEVEYESDKHGNCHLCGDVIDASEPVWTFGRAAFCCREHAEGAATQERNEARGDYERESRIEGK